MTYKVILPQYYDQCPSWWGQIHKNGHSKAKSFIEDNHGVIHYINEYTIEFIEFPSEEHYTWMLLKI